MSRFIDDTPENSITTTNGISHYVGRAPSWSRLGTVIDRPMGVDEAMGLAHMKGWNVRKEGLVIPQPAIITDDGVTTPQPLQVPDRYATVRTNPISGQPEFVGVVGEKYTCIQNEDNVELVEAFRGESGATIETIGALGQGGRLTFLTLRLPDTIMVNGQDRTDLYLVILNSHDGSSAMRVMLSPIRFDCANMWNAAVQGAVSSFTIRHTKTAQQAIGQARQALSLANRYADGFERVASFMADTAMDLDAARALFHQLAGDQDRELKPATLTRRQALFAGLDAQLQQTITLPDALRYTRFGVYNAVTEYFDHVVPVRGKEGTAADQVRALRSTGLMSSTTVAVKARAFGLLTGELQTTR